MHRSLATILLVLVLLTSAALLLSPVRAAPQYGWTISASSTDPFQNSDGSVGAMRYLYLWFNCSTTEGMAAAEFDLDGTIPIYGVLPMNGFLNGGSGTTLFLAIGGCPATSICAATIVVGDFLPGDICLGPSSTSGSNVTFDCGQFPQVHGNTWVGFTTEGPVPCSSRSELCRKPVSVDASSFGQIKSLYR